MKAKEIKESAMGKIKIYLKPKDKMEGGSFMDKLKPRQVYRELVKSAKNDGILSAAVYHTHSGFSIGDKIRTTHVELENNEQTLCIELIDEKEKLEIFCKKHGNLLKDKMIVFKAVEFWEIV